MYYINTDNNFLKVTYIHLAVLSYVILNNLFNKNHGYNVVLVTITVDQTSLQFSPSLLSKNDRILRKYGSFSSSNIFRKPHHLRFIN